MRLYVLQWKVIRYKLQRENIFIAELVREWKAFYKIGDDYFTDYVTHVFENKA